MNLAHLVNFEIQIAPLKLKQCAKSKSTNNWAVIVDSSAFWYNYRHSANVLSIYSNIKRLGIPDSNIILFLAEDIACNSRNKYPGIFFSNTNLKEHYNNLYVDEIEVDYRGSEVSVDNFIRLLTDRQDLSLPRSKRLLSDKNSNILIYMTGHGGEDFLKFRDNADLSSQEFADTVNHMYQLKRYNSILFIIDTCHAESMFTKIYSPNVVSIASSRRIEDSFSYSVDYDIGVYNIDRFSYHMNIFLENLTPEDSLEDLSRVCPTELCISTPVMASSSKISFKDIKVVDFFASQRHIDLTESVFDLNKYDIFM
ncbi:GPI transamidase [Intoshia linei]|uniref:GPI transamidase n=1 Tax=Intoshia linei TaxID=1819745 RepID=A0A177B9U3_9BILA|nr:GPI transamidase [Intoshia linei]